MLKPKKKIGKKELKQDALVTTYATVTMFYEKYKKPIGIALTVAVVTALATIAYVRNKATDDQNASAQLSLIMPYFDSENYTVALDGIPENNVRGLRAIAGDFGGTETGNHAQLYLGSALLNLELYDDALKAFEDVSPSGPILTSAREAGMASCFESRRDYRMAAEHFEKAASAGDVENTVSEYYSCAARNYALAGDTTRSIALYEKLKKEYPASTAGKAADRYLARLSG